MKTVCGRPGVILGKVETLSIRTVEMLRLHLSTPNTVFFTTLPWGKVKAGLQAFGISPQRIRLAFCDLGGLCGTTMNLR